jgi:hypothetical protein
MKSCTFFKCVINNHFTTYILPHSPTLQHHFEPSLTHTMLFFPIWGINEGASKSKDARAHAENTNNSMSKLQDITFMNSHIMSLNYCILQRKEPKQKPHLPSLAHVTHICEGRKVGLIVSWNIRYTIQHWVVLYSIHESKPCIQFEVKFWYIRTNLN